MTTVSPQKSTVSTEKSYGKKLGYWEWEGDDKLEVMLQYKGWISILISVVPVFCIMVAHLWLWKLMGWDTTTHGWFSKLNGLVKYSMHFGFAVVAFFICTTVILIKLRFNTNKVLEYPSNYETTQFPRCEFCFKYFVSPLAAAVHILGLCGMIWTFRITHKTYNGWYHVWAWTANLAFIPGIYTFMQPIFAFMWAELDATQKKIDEWTTKYHDVVDTETSSAEDFRELIDSYRDVCRAVKKLWDTPGMQVPWITWTMCSGICLFAMSVHLLKRVSWEATIFGYVFFVICAISVLVPVYCVSNCTKAVHRLESNKELVRIKVKKLGKECLIPYFALLQLFRDEPCDIVFFTRRSTFAALKTTINMKFLQKMTVVLMFQLPAVLTVTQSFLVLIHDKTVASEANR